MRLLDSLRLGMTSAGLGAGGKLSNLVSVFVSRASLILSQPLHPLYVPLQRFFLAKVALDIHAIPEFLQLMHSSEVEHEAHRLWILRVLREGIRTDDDVKTCIQHNLFKMLLNFYSCSIAQTNTKVRYDSMKFHIEGDAKLSFFLLVTSAGHLGNTGIRG